LQVKQVYVSNKARSIARLPLNPFRNTLDLLDERGERLTLTEEAPVYTGLLGLTYRLLGEHDWFGRVLSLLGTVAAIVAYADLARREHGPAIGHAGALLLAVAPLLEFYGRAVMPDTWMLAAMLTAATCYRRHLDGLGRGWLIGTACAAALAPLFKYYGVMILVPLAGMTVHHKRSCLRRASLFLIIGTATLVPVGLWMITVFLRTPNPITAGWSGDGHAMPYLVFQAPRVLLSPGFYTRGFILRFLVHDCGPVTSALVVLGVVAAMRGRCSASEARPALQSLSCWSVMGLAFYVLFAPKLIDHDYYELMLLPAAATWGAWGLSWLAASVKADTRWRVAIPLGVLVLAAVVQSPWCMSGMFRIDRAKLILAERLKACTDKGRRVVVIGPGIELATAVHYCDREGWALQMQRLPEQSATFIERYRAAGAQVLAVYFDPKATPVARRSLGVLTQNLPVLERGAGAWARIDGTCSYWILDLR
jgi:4-amino-4-deoxy-L-arabinose transferase-like glycosyltransferase